MKQTTLPFLIPEPVMTRKADAKPPSKTPRAKAQPEVLTEKAGTDEALPIKRPQEASIAEGNLVENPIWVLARQGAKPGAKGRSIKVEEFTRRIDFPETVINGKLVESHIQVVATPLYGFPTMFAFRVMIAIIQEARLQKHFLRSEEMTAEQNKVRVTFRQLEQLLEVAHSGDSYDSIRGALNALAHTKVSFHNAWHDKKTDTKGSRDGTTGLVDSFQLDARSKSNQESESSGWVRLSPELQRSLAAGYFNGISLPYLNALGRKPLAQRLYGYLTKKDGPSSSLQRQLQGALADKPNRWQFRQNMLMLGRRLGLDVSRPSVVSTELKAALEVLKTPVPAKDKKSLYQFVEDWEISGDPEMVSVRFFVDFESRNSIPARRSPR